MEFTTDQKAIITSKEKRMVVQAGPGSGKSTTIAASIEHKIKDEKRSGYDFLVITFSRFAAGQIRDKIKALGSDERNKIDIDTFHGFALKLINKFTASSWTVMSEEDLIHVMDDNGYWPISTPFKDFIRNKTLAPSARAEAVATFRKICDQFKWITYNQLLTTLVTNEDAMAWLNSRYKYLYVDEAQDMNPAQLNIAKLMDIEYTAYIGDVSQSIYEWNGAAPRILMELAKEHKVYTLGENHRSNAEIVKASSNLILHNKLRIEGDNKPTRGAGERCTFVHHRDDMYETIRGLIEKYDGDTAILCRTNREINNIAMELGDVGLSESLPSSVLRSNPLFTMLVSLVRLRLEQCRPHWMLFLRDNAKYDGHDFKTNKYAFSETIDHFESMAPEWVQDLLDEPDFMIFLKKFVDRLGDSLFSDSAILAQTLIAGFHRDSPAGTETDFLAWFATMNVQDIIPEEVSGVRIMTVHQSKGLEFDHVITILPKYKKTDEEGRRIVFVSLTRAIETLDIIAYPNNGYLKEMELTEESSDEPQDSNNEQTGIFGIPTTDSADTEESV